MVDPVMDEQLAMFVVESHRRSHPLHGKSASNVATDRQDEVEGSKTAIINDKARKGASSLELRTVANFFFFFAFHRRCSHLSEDILIASDIFLAFCRKASWVMDVPGLSKPTYCKVSPQFPPAIFGLKGSPALLILK